MKIRHILFIVVIAFTCTSYGQDKYNYTHFNTLTEVKGTEYVIAHIEKNGKIKDLRNRYLLFINTKTGATKQVDFPNEGYFQTIKQVKIDTLGINCMVVLAQTIDLDGKKGIDWNDPKQIIILSSDGKDKTQLTDNRFFVKKWSVNYNSGTIVVTGYYDTNQNGKYDKKDKGEIAIYDLKTLKLTHKINS